MTYFLGKQEVSFVFVADVDLTLTRSSAEMEEDMEAALALFLAYKRLHFYVCTGNDMPKIRQQIPPHILCQMTGVFAQLGCEFWWPEAAAPYWQRDLGLADVERKRLEKRLNELRCLSSFDTAQRTEPFLRDRGSTLCFSVLGVTPDMEARAAYVAHDNVTHERVRIVNTLRQEFPQLDVTKGGQTSIDISAKGANKAQILPMLRRHYGPRTPICFVGDGMAPDGNDYPLAQALRAERDERGVPNEVYVVDGPQDTLKMLVNQMQCWLLEKAMM